MRRLAWIAVAGGAVWCADAFGQSPAGADGTAESAAAGGTAESAAAGGTAESAAAGGTAESAAAGAPATPDSEGDPRDAQATALIEGGVQQRKAGDDRAALELFRRAFELNGSAQALAQMALAEQALGRWLDAHQHLRLALEQDHAWIQQHRPELMAALDDINAELGVLEVSCNVAGADVYADGRWLGRTPTKSFPMMAGQSVIRVTAPGYFAVARPVQVDAGGLSRVDITLTPNVTPAARAGTDAGSGTGALTPERPRAAAQGRSSRDWLMYASGGMAALGAATGVTGYVIREVNVRSYNDDDRCLRPDIRRSVVCADEESAWRLGENIAIAGLVTAAVFGALGLYLWIDRPDPSASRETACVLGARGLSCSSTF